MLTGLVVDNSFYRAQVEHDLRAKLLRFRQKSAGLLGDPDLMRRLLLDSFSTFCVLFRHALLLTAWRRLREKGKSFGECAGRFGLDAAPFEKLLSVREQNMKAVTWNRYNYWRRTWMRSPG